MPPRQITGYIWESIRNQFATPTEALSELIDNSIDAGATTVEIVCRAKEFYISDNGNGIEDPARMLDYGYSQSKKHKAKSGEYGVGGKHGLAFFGNVIYVQSVHGGKCRWVEWDTQKDIDTDVYGEGCGATDSEDAGSERGTIIWVTELRQPRRLRNCIGRLAMDFWPAIDSGVSITVDDIPLRASLPELAEEITLEGAIRGQRFEMRGGVLKGSNPNAGVHACRINRFVTRMHPIQEISGADGIFAIVRLHVDKDKDWRLTNDKSAIANEEDCAALIAVLEEHLKPLIDASKQQVQHINTPAWQLYVENHLPLSMPSEEGDHGLGGDGEETNSGKHGKKDTPIDPAKPRPRRHDRKDDTKDTHEIAEADQCKAPIELIWEPLPNAHKVRCDQKTGKVIVHLSTNDPYYSQRAPLTTENKADILHAIGSIIFDKMLHDHRYAKYVTGWAEAMKDWQWDHQHLNAHFMMHWDKMIAENGTKQ